MDLTPALIAAFATLFAAGVTATVSLVVSILSKEQKTSEMRQQWIDALRDDISELISELMILRVIGEHADVSTPLKMHEYIEKRQPNLLKVGMLLSRIELRLTPADHQPLIRLLHDVSRKVSPSNKGPEHDEIAGEGLRAVSDECGRVLRQEWARVQRGEPAFVSIKRFAKAIVGLSFVAIVLLAYRAW